MPKIIFTTPDGSQQEVDAAVGTSVMENAVNNGVPGIVAECGGACSCATCHIYVDAEWLDRVGEPGVQEADMLDFAAEPRNNSRLSCQLEMRDDLDGLRVSVPASQG